MSGKQHEEGQSKGTDSRIPARGPSQGLQISSECLPLHLNPLLSLWEVDKYPHFNLFQLETLISNADISLPPQEATLCSYARCSCLVPATQDSPNHVSVPTPGLHFS